MGKVVAIIIEIEDLMHMSKEWRLIEIILTTTTTTIIMVFAIDFGNDYFLSYVFPFININ
jgi:hypothetical protein